MYLLKNVDGNDSDDANSHFISPVGPIQVHPEGQSLSGDITVTATTNYEADDLSNIPEIDFNTTAPSASSTPSIA